MFWLVQCYKWCSTRKCAWSSPFYCIYKWLIPEVVQSNIAIFADDTKLHILYTAKRSRRKTFTVLAVFHSNASTKVFPWISIVYPKFSHSKVLPYMVYIFINTPDNSITLQSDLDLLVEWCRFGKWNKHLATLRLNSPSRQYIHNGYQYWIASDQDD